MADKSTTQRLQEYIDNCRELIRTHGHYVQSILGERTTPPWSYTVGLTLQGLPELVVFGLEGNLSTSVLNQVAARIAEAPGTDADLSNILNVALRLQRVPAAPFLEHMQFVRRLLPGLTYEVIVVRWTDADGRFPDDPGYDHPTTQSLDDLTPKQRH